MEDLKSIRLELPYCDTEGNFKLKTYTVNFKQVKTNDEDYGRFQGYGGKLLTYSMNFTVVLPDEVHKKVVGEFVGRPHDHNTSTYTYSKEFSKTLSNNSLSGLTSHWRNVMLDYQWLLRREQQKLDKVIFYNFSSNDRQNKTSHYDSKKLGSHIKTEFEYAIGYMSEDKKTRFNVDKKYLSKDDLVIFNAKYIAYSETNELFFKTLYSKYQLLNTKMAEFDTKLDADFIKTIMNNDQTLLLSL